MDAGDPAATMSKSLTLLAAIAICGLSSCDKIRSLADLLGKKAPAHRRRPDAAGFGNSQGSP